MITEGTQGASWGQKATVAAGSAWNRIVTFGGPKIKTAINFFKSLEYKKGTVALGGFVAKHWMGVGFAITVIALAALSYKAYKKIRQEQNEDLENIETRALKLEKESNVNTSSEEKKDF